MAKTQFLTILLTVTCFLGGVVSVTDKGFEDLMIFVRQQAETNERQAAINKQLKEATGAMMEIIKQQDIRIKELESNIQCDETIDGLMLGKNLVQNTTIEERVALLEIQVVVIQDDLTEVDEDVTGLDQDVNFLFDEQVIQDERLLGLEQGINVIESDLDVIDDELENLQDTTFALDFRVTTLEENGGGDGNSSVAELEVRVETLEGTASDHETRISAVEADVNGLEGITSDHETRLTAVEENIQGLQITDVELDERVTALEENGGDGQNATVAFHTVLTTYSSIPVNSAVEFNEVLVDEGDGYDSTTGTFTVPPGGDGYYYFSVYAPTTGAETTLFDVEINGQRICTVRSDLTESPANDSEITTCSGVTYAVQGDTVRVVYTTGTDTTPLAASTSYYYNGFTGFRI